MFLFVVFCCGRTTVSDDINSSQGPISSKCQNMIDKAINVGELLLVAWENKEPLFNYEVN